VRRALVLVGIALTALPALAIATPASAAVAVPPDLQALEQKMLALKPNSVRYRIELSVTSKPRVQGPIGGFGQVFGKASDVSETLLEASGEVSAKPQLASVQMQFLGLNLNARLVGTTLYVEEPFIKRIDGGRPWVEKRNQTLHDAIGGGLGGGVNVDPTSGFSSLGKIVGEARAIRELGPATIDGQATKAFRISSDLAHTTKLSRREKRRLLKILAPLATVELFIAENGLPVRSRIIVRERHGRGRLITQVDIPAIEIPVSVQPPPAGETISQARLDRRLASLRAHRRHRKSKQ
jgi:hypothetical protein